MSYHWENDIWQSKDGTWNRGFYERISTGDSFDEDYDSEWDDEFATNRFAHLRTGFRTFEEACAWKPTGNPGSFTQIPYKGNSKACKELDLLAYYHTHPEEHAKAKRKIILAKNREHFKAMAEEWPAALLQSCVKTYTQLEVSVKFDEEVHTNYGSTTLYKGVLKQEGAWLMLEKQRVFNVKTGKFAPRIRKIRKVTYSRW